MHLAVIETSRQQGIFLTTQFRNFFLLPIYVSLIFHLYLYLLSYLLVQFLSGFFWGCGSNGGSGGDSTSGAPEFGTDPDGNAYVGAGECVDCHQGLSFSQEAVADYLESKHVIHSSHINAGSDASCLLCHDPIGDGRTLEPFIDPEDVPAEGLAAVGCEVCHGGGGQHFGVGPMPNVNPDFTVCGECHNALPESHIPHHPFADNILDNYLKSAHYADGEARDSSPCFRCHSDEGFRDYIGTTTGLDADELDARLAGVSDLTVATPVQCRTCHDPHSGELRANEATARIRLDTDGDGNSDTTVEPRPVSFSREFNLCTSCHMAFLDEEAAISTDPDTMVQEFEGYFDYTLDTTRRVYHDTSSSRIITDTHFNDGAEIVGYNINAADEKACTICHDPHGATKFEQSFAKNIAEAWGNTELFHGDYQNFPTRDSQSCARCHSGTEHVKWINGLEDWDLSADEARVVGCVTCHDLTVLNDSGDDFDLGALRDYVREEIFFPPFPTEDNVDIFQPIDPARFGLDTEIIGSDAFCAGCHLGRGGKGDVDEEIADNIGTSGSISRNDNHHGYAAATRYGNMAKGGYEYDQRANADGQYLYSSKFEHVVAYDECNECHSVHSGSVDYEDCGICHNASDGQPVATEED